MEVALRVEEYVRPGGSIPFKRPKLDDLNLLAAAKVATAVARLSLGNTSTVKWFSGIGELRIDWGPGTGHVKGTLTTTSGPATGVQAALASIVLVRSGELWQVAAFHNTPMTQTPRGRRLTEVGAS